MNENPAASICELPEQYQILTPRGGIQSKFIADHRRHSDYLAKVLPQEQNRDVGSYPTDNPEEFVKLYKKSPVMQQMLTLELLTILDEIRKTRMVNGKKLHDHQYAQIIWLQQALCAGIFSPETFLIQGSGGIGKTLILGIITEALIRLQIRDLVGGRIVYCANKSFILMQQLFSQYDIERNAQHAEGMTLKDRLDTFRFAEQLTGGNVVFTRKCIDELCLSGCTATEAKQRLTQELGNHADAKRRYPSLDWNGILERLSLVIAGSRFLIRSPNKRDLEMIELAEATKKGKARSGDLGFGIPAEYKEEDLILAKRGADLDVQTFEKCSDPESLRKDQRYRVLLTLVSTLQKQAQFQTIAHLAGNIRALLIDEVQKIPGNEFQKIILRAREGNSEEKKLPSPLVFGLRAERYGDAVSLGNMINYHRRSPRPPLAVAMNSSQRILPPVSPVRPDAHDLDPESPEGLRFLVRSHFEEMPLLKKMGHPQPWKHTGMIVVHPDNVETLVKMLREEYAGHKGLKSDVHSLNANTAPPYSGRLLSLMHGEKKNHARVLVTSPSLVKLALDLQRMSYLTIGTDFQIRSPGDLLRYLDRLSHSSLHRTVPNFRCLLRHPFFRTGDPRLSLFNVLEHDEPVNDVHAISWLQGQALLGSPRYRADKAFIAKHHLEGDAETVIVGNEPKEKKPRRPRGFRSFLAGSAREGTAHLETPSTGKPGQFASTAEEFLHDIGDWEDLPKKFRKWEEDWSPLFLMRKNAEDWNLATFKNFVWEELGIAVVTSRRQGIDFRNNRTVTREAGKPSHRQKRTKKDDKPEESKADPDDEEIEPDEEELDQDERVGDDDFDDFISDNDENAILDEEERCGRRWDL